MIWFWIWVVSAVLCLFPALDHIKNTKAKGYTINYLGMVRSLRRADIIMEWGFCLMICICPIFNTFFALGQISDWLGLTGSIKRVGERISAWWNYEYPSK